MYAKNDVIVTYFVDETAKHTEKVFYGRISEAINVGVDETGKKKFKFEGWNVRFVGKARKKAETLENKTSIVLHEWNARCPYNKEKDASYPHLVITDFDIFVPLDPKE